MTISFAAPQDIDGWMELVRQVRDSFPGLETEQALAEHRRTVLEFMAQGGAICARCGGQIVGALLFSREDRMLCFLVVDKARRREHIAQRMVERMLACMEPHQDVVVTTYREGAPEGAAARAFYKRMGFTEGRLTEEFGSPVQEFVLKRALFD